MRQKYRNEKGHFSSLEYTVYESPVRENQPHPEKLSTVNPYPDNPSTKNLPLLNKHLRLNKQDTKNTTTNRDDYIWASQLSGLHKGSIYSLLTDVNNKEDIQLLLDELSGQLDNIKNPVGYFRTLLQSYLLGEFTPAKAIQIQSNRKKKKENELALERSRQYHEEQLNQLINNTMRPQHNSLWFEYFGKMRHAKIIYDTNRTFYLNINTRSSYFTQS